MIPSLDFSSKTSIFSKDFSEKADNIQQRTSSRRQTTYNKELLAVGRHGRQYKSKILFKGNLPIYIVIPYIVRFIIRRTCVVVRSVCRGSFSLVVEHHTCNVKAARSIRAGSF